MLLVDSNVDAKGHFVPFKAADHLLPGGGIAQLRVASLTAQAPRRGGGSCAGELAAAVEAGAPEFIMESAWLRGEWEAQSATQLVAHLGTAAGGRPFGRWGVEGRLHASRLPRAARLGA